MGANLTLDCEARGFPAPIISRQYENVEGETVRRRELNFVDMRASNEGPHDGS